MKQKPDISAGATGSIRQSGSERPSDITDAARATPLPMLAEVSQASYSLPAVVAPTLHLGTGVIAERDDVKRRVWAALRNMSVVHQMGPHT